MPKIRLWFFLLFVYVGFAQQSDFNHINFSKADKIAKTVRSKKLYDLNKLTYKLTNTLDTDVEKVRAIYVWICTNIANDFSLYALNQRKRKRFAKDSIELQNWNSKFKKKLFKKLLKKKRTICTGYAYLLKEMCAIAGIESKMVNGFGRTSTVDFSGTLMPNHTWNVIKINQKWYLCDPTWATGISFPEEGKFKFIYNDGYFLTEPKLFFLNHFPLESKYALLGKATPSFTDFVESPLLYGDAYKVIDAHIFPKKMHQAVKINQAIFFKYKLQHKINSQKVKFVLVSGNNERKTTPKISLSSNMLILEYEFRKKGFYDVHLYYDDKILATYTFSVTP